MSKSHRKGTFEHRARRAQRHVRQTRMVRANRRVERRLFTGRTISAADAQQLAVDLGYDNEH